MRKRLIAGHYPSFHSVFVDLNQIRGSDHRGPIKKGGWENLLSSD
jgi:hypothetical protein